MENKAKHRNCKRENLRIFSLFLKAFYFIMKYKNNLSFFLFIKCLRHIFIKLLGGKIDVRKLYKVLLLICLLTSSIFLVFSTSPFIFDAKILKINQLENYHYNVELEIENFLGERTPYQVKIFHENTSLVLGSKTIYCSSKCQDSIKLNRVIFGNQKILITAITPQGKIKKELHFNLELEKKLPYDIKFKPIYNIPQDKNNMIINGKIETNIQKETQYLFEYFPISKPSLKKQTTILCKNSCDFSFLLEAPYIIDKYRVNIYSSLGETSKFFRIDVKKNKTKELILDSKNNKIPATIKYKKNNQELNESEALNQLVDLELNLSTQNGSNGVKKIVIPNASISEVAIGFEYVNKQRASREFSFEVENAFAINPIVNPEVKSYNLTYVASGEALYKCTEYNFSTQTCFGTFKKILDTIPGKEYTLTLTPQDPLFVEIPIQTFKVQRGTTSSTLTTFSDTISPVVMNQTLVLFTSRTADNNPNDWQYSVNLTNSTNLEFSRYAGGGSLTNVSWQTIESNLFTVDRGVQSVAISTNSVIVPIGRNINISSSFGVAYGRCNSATTNNNHAGFFLIEILNSTHINLERGQGNLCAATVSWQVVDFQGASVQSNRSSFTSTGTTLSSTINSVNTQNSFLFFGTSASTGTDRGMETNFVYGELSSGTNVQFTRDADVGTSDRDMFYYVVEHPQLSVQRASFSSGVDSTKTITSVNTSRAFHFSSSTNTGGGQSYSNNAHTFTLTNSTSLFFDKETGSQTITASYEVIEFTPNIFNVSAQVNLTSESGFDLTTDTLTCSYDLGPDATTAGVSWQVNSNPLMNLFLPIEGGATNALVDISGHFNNATCINCPTWNSSGGKDLNGSFEFDGFNTNLDLGNSSIFDFTSNVTLMAWAKMSGQSINNDFSRIISKGQSTTTDGAYGLWVSDPDSNSIGCRFISSGVAQDATYTTGIENDNLWHHYVCSYDGSIIKLYVDGVQVANNTTSFTIDKTTANLEIGTGNSQRFFNGSIDDVRIYDRTLSSEQILAIYQNRTNQIVPEETLGGDLWTCSATPYSQTQIGPTYFSNQINISTDYEFLNLTQITPTSDISVYQFEPFNVTVNASCDGTLNCTLTNISLYYETIDSIGETGIISTSGTTQNKITFKNTYNTTPIIVAVVGSNNNMDNNPLIPVVHSINKTEATLSLCQDAGATTCSASYTTEDIHYIVIDRQKAQNYNWIDVGNVSTSTNGVAKAFSFGQTFTNSPYLYSLPQTYNIGGTNIAAHNWFTSITTTGANIIGCDHPGVGDVCAGTGTENFGYIAVDPVLIDFAKSNLGTQSISNSLWTPISYGQTYTNPVVLVGVNSENGGQDPAYPLARSVTTTGADIRYCENDGANYCDTHSAETTRWLSFEKGLIQVRTASTLLVQITNTTDTTPFYITNLETQNINLSVNESKLINFELIPTGNALSNYTLFAKTSSERQLEKFNVSILESSFDVTLNNPINPSSVIMNNTFDVNITINCNGFCSGDFSATALYTSNLSLEGNQSALEKQALDINTSIGAVPLYTISSQPQTCSTPINGQCNLIWTVNATGSNFSQHLVGAKVISNSLGNITTTFSKVTIIDRKRIIINQTQINFTVLANFQGDSGTANFNLYGAPHNNMSLSCVSGDCTEFSDTFIDNSNYLIDGAYSFGVSCYATSAGNFSAIFKLISNEDTVGDEINLSCSSTELQLYINLVDPDTTQTYNALFNTTFNLTLNVTCNQAGGCNNTKISLAKKRDQIGEVGRISLVNFNEKHVTFTNSYSQSPIIIATPSTNNQADNNALIPVITNVTTTGFDIKLCQDAGLTTCSTILSSEDVDYMVFDKEKTNNYSWIEVGSVSALSNGGNTPITFNKTFANTPYIFAQSQTDNDGGTAIAPTSWAHTITTTNAQLIACDHPGVADACAGTTTETFGYVAIDVVVANLSLFDSGSQSISSSLWTGITFTQNYSTPIIAVLQNSDTGAQDPQYPWARNLNFAGSDIRYCEQDGNNVCDSHSAETVVWMSFEQGPIEVGSSIELVSNVAGTTPIYSLTTNPQIINLSNNQTKSVVFQLNSTGSLETLFSLYGVLENGITSQFLDVRIVYYLISLQLQKLSTRIDTNLFNLTLNLNSFSEYGTPPNQDLFVYVFIPENITLNKTFTFSNSTQYITSKSNATTPYKNFNGTIYNLKLSPKLIDTSVFDSYLGSSNQKTSWQSNFTISTTDKSDIFQNLLIGLDPQGKIK